MSLLKRMLTLTPKLVPEPAEGRSCYDELPRYRLGKEDLSEFKDTVLARVLVTKLGYQEHLVQQLTKNGKIELLVAAQRHYKTFSRRSFVLRFGPHPNDLFPLLVEPDSSVIFANALKVSRSEVKRRQQFVARTSPPQEDYKTPKKDCFGGTHPAQALPANETPFVNSTFKTPSGKSQVFRTPASNNGPMGEKFADDLEESPAKGIDGYGEGQEEEGLLGEEDGEALSRELVAKAAAAAEAYTEATTVAKQAAKAAKAAAKRARKAHQAVERNHQAIRGYPFNTNGEDTESPLRKHPNSPAPNEHVQEPQDVDMHAVIRERVQLEIVELKKQLAQVATGLDHLAYVLADGVPVLNSNVAH